MFCKKTQFNKILRGTCAVKENFLQVCFTYEVLETFCNLPILAANPKNCLHRTPHFPMTSQRAHPTAPNPRHSMAQRRVRSKHHTCTTPQRRARAFPHHCTRPLHDAGYASSHHALPVPIRNAAPVPLHGAVRVSTHGAVPAPHHAAKPHAAHSTAPGPPRPPPQHCSRAAGSLETKK